MRWHRSLELCAELHFGSVASSRPKMTREPATEPGSRPRPARRRPPRFGSSPPHRWTRVVPHGQPPHHGVARRGSRRYRPSGARRPTRASLRRASLARRPRLDRHLRPSQQHQPAVLNEDVPRGLRFVSEISLTELTVRSGSQPRNLFQKEDSSFPVGLATLWLA